MGNVGLIPSWGEADCTKSKKRRLYAHLVSVETRGLLTFLLSPSDLKIDTPVDTLPGAWHCRASAGTGWPGFSILRLGEVESLICSFYLSVAARKIVCADPSLRYTSMLVGR